MINLDKFLSVDRNTFNSNIKILADRKSDINVAFPNGKEKTMNVKIFIANSFIWRVMYNNNITIDSSNIFFKKNDIILGKKFEKIFLKMYIDLLKRSNFDYSLYDKFSKSIWEFENDLMNFIIVNCNEYVSSISLNDMLDLRFDPGFIKAIQIDDDISNISVKQMEKIEKERKKKLIKYIKSTDNPFKPLVDTEMLNETQLFNILGSIGYKTDIDDSIFPKYVKESYLDGIKSDADYALESLSSKKAQFYNKSGIKLARSFEREIQLASTAIENVYPGDCGASPIPFLITKKNVKCCIGKWIVNEDGSETLIDFDNYQNYIDQVVQMRSGLMCKHTDGVCEKCGGLITFFFPRRFNLGMLSSTNVIEPVSQRILSAKHFTAITPIEWKNEVNHELFKYFRIVKDSLYMTKIGKQSLVGIPTPTIKTIINLPYLDFEYLDETNLIPIDRMLIYNRNGECEEGPFELSHQNTTPKFSMEFVDYFRKNPSIINILDDKLTLIDISKFPISKPIMKIELFTDSSVMFVKSVRLFFKSKLQHYTDACKALKDISDLILNRIQINVTYVECLLKTFLVTSSSDYKIPVVEDYKNVRFSNLDTINSNRNLSIAIGFKNQAKVFFNPNFFLNPRYPSEFDGLFDF